MQVARYITLLCSANYKSIAAAMLLALISLVAGAQELFNFYQPASVLPKGVLGMRAYDLAYKEVDQMRNIFAYKFMYGLSSKLTLSATVVVSNYHQKELPFDFITHSHTVSGEPTGNENAVQKGIKYPYIFDGVDLYGQYRFYSDDGENQHFRMAAYGEASYIDIQSHFTEPVLEDHNTGLGGGLIATYLKKHFAASFTAGFILSKEFSGNTYDRFGGTYPTILKYGDAVNYDLSFGYLLFPRHYSNYNETNWNIYMEFAGKTYGAATVQQIESPFAPYNNYITFPNTAQGLKAGSYIEIYPGVQCILKSNVRIDFSVGLPFIGQSYLHNYPFYLLGIQRYFYFNK